MLEREACEARSLLNRLAEMLTQEPIKDLQQQNDSHHNDFQQSDLVKAQNLIKQFGLTSGLLFDLITKENKKNRLIFNMLRYSSNICSSTRTSFNFTRMF